MDIGTEDKLKSKEGNSQSDAETSSRDGRKKKSSYGAGNADREALCRRDHHNHHHDHQVCMADRYQRPLALLNNRQIIWLFPTLAQLPSKESNQLCRPLSSAYKPCQKLDKRKSKVSCRRALTDRIIIWSPNSPSHSWLLPHLLLHVRI